MPQHDATNLGLIHDSLVRPASHPPDYTAEAFAILGGRSLIRPRIEHLRALAELLALRDEAIWELTGRRITAEPAPRCHSCGVVADAEAVYLPGDGGCRLTCAACALAIETQGQGA